MPPVLIQMLSLKKCETQVTIKKEKYFFFPPAVVLPLWPRKRGVHCNVTAPRVYIMHSVHRLLAYILCTQCTGSQRKYNALNAPAPRVYVMHSMHRLPAYILCTQCESCIARAKQDRILQRMQTEEFGHVFELTHYTLHMQSPPTFFWRIINLIDDLK